MAVVQRSEFTLALNQIASERGVDPEVVIETIKGAILAAYKKDHPIPEEEEVDYVVDLNSSNGETKIIKKGMDVTPPGFGRIAAQTAKQVLLQKIREREKDAIFEEYSKRIGTVVNGMILRFAGPNIIVDIGKAEAMIPPAHKIPNESYYLNKKMPVYIVEISEEVRGREIIVSRTEPGLIEGLLKREVPEVNSGSVIVKRVVREPGSRAKIAVYSEQSGIDPVGSCVGQKGVRIQAVIDALDGLEKIDVIQWSGDAAKFITNALSPAKNLTVELDEKTKTANVKAPMDEVKLVIGREGQNVRLASKLTEWNIEVEGTASIDESPEQGPGQAGESTEEAPVEEQKAEVEEKVIEEKESPKEKVEESIDEKGESPEEAVSAESSPKQSSEQAVESKEELKEPETEDEKSAKTE